MDLTQLKAEVERQTQVNQSAVTLIQGLAAKLEEFKDDPAQIQAMAEQLRGSANELAEAVQANTPSS